MKIATMIRGNKEYVYLYTSKRVKGRKNPAVIKRYVGILDRETGLVAPKKVPPETFLAQIHDGEFTCQDLGSILVARKVAEDLGIPGNLERIFGEGSDVAYALVLAIAVNPVHRSDYLRYVSMYYLDDIIGKRGLTARDIDRALGDFHTRMSTAYLGAVNVKERYVFIIGADLGNADHHHGIPYGLADGTASGRMFFIVTDTSGNPLFLRSSSVGSSVAESLRTAMAHAGSADSGDTFVLDRTLPVEALVAIFRYGMGFIMNADGLLDDDVLAGLTGELADDWSSREFDSASYRVLETNMGIFADGGGFRTVFGGPDRTDGAAIVLRAAVWYDHDEYERRVKELSVVTRRRVDAIKNMPFETAREHLADGSAESRFISVRENDDGSTGVTVHRGMRRHAALRSSIHMFVSDRMAWEEGMRCIKVRRDVVSHSKPIARVASDRKERSGYSYLFLALTAMTIQMNLERTVRDMGLGYVCADEVFQAASSYRAVRVNDHVYRSAMTREAESLFEALGIDAGASDVTLLENVLSSTEHDEQ